MAKKKKSSSSRANEKKLSKVNDDISDDDGGDKIYNDMDYLDLSEDNNLLSKIIEEDTLRYLAAATSDADNDYNFP